MGLGPAVCEHCHLISEYHPNIENPNKQGKHLCPQCGLECNNNLFEYAKYRWDEIMIFTEIVKENRGPG